MVPGNRLVIKSRFTIPGLMDMRDGVNAATPIGLIPAALPQTPTPLKALFDQGVFSALIVMVMATTLVTPPLLQWSFGRFAASTAAAETYDLPETVSMSAPAMEGSVDVSMAG